MAASRFARYLAGIASFIRQPGGTLSLLASFVMGISVNLVSDILKTDMAQAAIVSILVVIFVSWLILQAGMASELRDIRTSHTLRVRYFDAEPHEDVDVANASIIVAFDEMRRVVLTARNTLRVLNAHIEERSGPGQADPHWKALDGARDKYLKAIESSVSKKSEIKYVRVVQLARKGSKNSAAGPELMKCREVYAKPYVDHFRWMTDERSESVKILQAAPKYPTSFAIVDREHVLLQLFYTVPREKDAGGEKSLYRFRGVMIINDPHREMVPYFEAMFEDRAGTNANLEPEHL